MALRLLIVAAVASCALAAGASAQTTTASGIEAAVEALASDPVYVDPGAEATLSEAEADRLRGEIARADGGPIYLAVLPDEARAEAGGDAAEVLRRIAEGLGRPGTYAAVVGGEFRAGSTTLPRGEAAEIATRAFESQGGNGVAATLEAFVAGVGQRAQGGGSPGDGDGATGFGGIVLLVLLAGGGIMIFAARRRRRREQRQEMEDVRVTARDDLIALGEDIRALDLDIEMPAVDPRAREDYATALDRYERADDLLERARGPEDLAPVGELLEEGRYAMTSAKARLDGREPPERRPPCFFDPRHGPSGRDVEWAPPGGIPRPVPACEADAQRVEAGIDPHPREITVGGQTMPYWYGPPAYQSFAGGFFGGFGGGLLPGLLIGSMMGSAFGGLGHAYADPGQDVGDFGGGGDFGDFGGGDFGGGGDF